MSSPKRLHSELTSEADRQEFERWLDREMTDAQLEEMARSYERGHPDVEASMNLDY